jgi:two-component system chemotaxis sensor kinase CheA
MIDDPELRGLFRAESEEHLQTLENGLLRLESQPADTRILDDLFRSAHSLKGAARMLEVDRLETLAHHFEDELSAARRGHRTISSEGADRLYQGLDAMRRLAQEACGGAEAQVDIPRVLAQMRGETVAELDPSPQETVEVAVAAEVPSAITPVSTSPSPNPGANPDGIASAEHLLPELTGPILDDDWSPVPFKIETIRVEPQRLDALMTLAGEMAVTTARAVRALNVVSELGDLWEEWTRDTARMPVSADQAKDSDRLKRLGELLGRLERTGDEEIARLSMVAEELVESVRDLRLLPLSTVFSLFNRMVRDLSHEAGKLVRLEIAGGTVTADKHLLEELKDPLMHMIRNAVDHAIETPEERVSVGKQPEAVIRLNAYRTATRMVIEITDDGRGLNEKAIGEAAVRKQLLTEEAVADLSLPEIQRLIFAPGFSTMPLITDVSGRGVGLDVVRTNVERLKGTISVESCPGRGCTFRIEAPISLATTRVLLVGVGDRSYAIPIEAVQMTFLVSPKEVFPIEGHPTIRWEGLPVRVVALAELLELPLRTPQRSPSDEPDWPGVLLTIGSQRLGLFVDSLVDEQEVTVKPFGGLLKRVRNVLGSTILSTGEICMVLNPADLIASLQRRPNASVTSNPVPELGSEAKKVILLAEDSITTRTQEKRILEAAGYEVVTAVDGADAFVKLRSRPFDAVVSDVEMPNMTGLQLAERIRQEPKHNELPIILVTSLATDEDRKRGVEVGANAYITKGTFDQRALLDILKKLV